jgi:hypothetical protein
MKRTPEVLVVNFTLAKMLMGYLTGSSHITPETLIDADILTALAIPIYGVVSADIVL